MRTDARIDPRVIRVGRGPHSDTDSRPHGDVGRSPFSDSDRRPHGDVDRSPFSDTDG